MDIILRTSKCSADNGVESKVLVSCDNLVKESNSYKDDNLTVRHDNSMIFGPEVRLNALTILRPTKTVKISTNYPNKTSLK